MLTTTPITTIFCSPMQSLVLRIIASNEQNREKSRHRKRIKSILIANAFFSQLNWLVKLIEPAIYDKCRSRSTCPKMIDIQLRFGQQVGTRMTKTYFGLCKTEEKKMKSEISRTDKYLITIIKWNRRDNVQDLKFKKKIENSKKISLWGIWVANKVLSNGLFFWK